MSRFRLLGLHEYDEKCLKTGTLVDLKMEQGKKARNNFNLQIEPTCTSAGLCISS